MWMEFVTCLLNYELYSMITLFHYQDTRCSGERFIFVGNESPQLRWLQKYAVKGTKYNVLAIKSASFCRWIFEAFVELMLPQLADVSPLLAFVFFFWKKFNRCQNSQEYSNIH